MIKYSSVGDLVLVEIGDKVIYKQVNDASEGVSCFYGNTAKLMNVETIVIITNK